MNGVFVDTDPESLLPMRYYAMFETYPPESWTLYVYEESNGLDGLQRQDEMVTSEACGHPADTVII